MTIRTKTHKICNVVFSANLQRNDVVDFSGVFVFFAADLTFVVKTLSQAFYTISVRSVMLYRKVMTYPFVFAHFMTFLYKEPPHC